MPDLVLDSEELFRRVPVGTPGYKVESDGSLTVDSGAFLDRKNKPSVDRAILCDEGPAYTQKGDATAGVLSLLTEDVRAIGNRDAVPNRTVDVIAAPLPVGDPDGPNPAHAEIQTAPEILEGEKKIFRKLRLALAILANRRGWAIKPTL